MKASCEVLETIVSVHKQEWTRAEGERLNISDGAPDWIVGQKSICDQACDYGNSGNCTRKVLVVDTSGDVPIIQESLWKSVHAKQIRELFDSSSNKPQLPE